MDDKQFDAEFNKLLGSVESPYLTWLKKRSAVLQAAADAHRRYSALPQRVLRWWQSLPQEQRKKAYLLSDLRAVFRVGPGRLGMALHECGFRRVRRWRGQGPY